MTKNVLHNGWSLLTFDYRLSNRMTHLNLTAYTDTVDRGQSTQNVQSELRSTVRAASMYFDDQLVYPLSFSYSSPVPVFN